jgi:hypothetical protein
VDRRRPDLASPTHIRSIIEAKFRNKELMREKSKKKELREKELYKKIIIFKKN